MIFLLAEVKCNLKKQYTKPTKLKEENKNGGRSEIELNRLKV